MAHYAWLDSDNKVINVIVGLDEDALLDGEVVNWEEVYLEKAALFSHEVVSVKRTSYNTYKNVHLDPETGQASDTQEKAFRGNYAAIGSNYDAENDMFLPNKPFDSWVLNLETASYDPPVPMPEDYELTSYYWDETNQQWVAGDYPYKPNNEYT